MVPFISLIETCNEVLISYSFNFWSGPDIFLLEQSTQLKKETFRNGVSAFFVVYFVNNKEFFSAFSRDFRGFPAKEAATFRHK